jgi:hypothetical protein
MCVGSIHRHGVILHEVGHTFGLPHWLRSKAYPYKRSMYGKDPGEPTYPNAGPTWAFDIRKRDFISPRQMVNGKLEWKRDPMQGGGWRRDKEYMYKHFSDYSVARIRDCLEKRTVFWNEETKKYARWNQETGAYDKVVENDGVQFPVERDVPVISVLATASAVTPGANIIYPPIGPYTAGLIRRFDAASAKGREAARALGYTEKTCNVCVRVTQGGKAKTYLLRLNVSADDDPLKAFHVDAINLPARDGEITRVDLLHTPNVMAKGLPADPKVLYRWKK